MPSTSCSTFCKSIISKNCFWLFQKFSTKNHFWVLFHSAKPISDHFRTLKNFEKFFPKIWNFYVSTPWLHRWKKWSQQKITFECSFIAQNPFQTILGLRKILKNFSQKFEIFMFRPLDCIGEKSEVNKKSLLSALS